MIQLLYGAIGSDEVAGPVFQHLSVMSRESNPGIAPDAIHGTGFSIGHVSRTFASWQSCDRDLSLWLDGVLLFIDGQETQSRGASPQELEHVARLYRRYGAGIWERLDGNFCLIVRDGPITRIGVDPAGTRAVYWWQAPGVVAFHSHLLDLAPCYPGELTEDLSSLGMFLASGAYPPGATPFHEVHQLSPGCHLVVSDGDVTVAEHFSMDCRPIHGRSRAELISELSALLTEAIGACWRAADRPVVPLSGGSDSRYIVAELAHGLADRSEIHTITWGVDRYRENSDAVVAAQLCSVLGLDNAWYEKTHDPRGQAAFARALYLSNGEADAAVEYPDDHLLHEKLAREAGYRSIFRGDECFGRGLPLYTRRSLLPVNDIARLSLYPGIYGVVLGAELLARLADEQDRYLAEMLDALRSTTPTGCRDEIYYGFRMRQVLAPYNRIKHADLEVFNPLIARRVLDWVRGVPDEFREDKALLREALASNFPEVAHIPFAERSNLPRAAKEFEANAELRRFYSDVIAGPGWLDRFDGKEALIASLTNWGSDQGAPVSNAKPRGSAIAQLPRVMRSAPKARIKATRLGHILWETMLEKRYARSRRRHLEVGRLAVLHRLIGSIDERRQRLPGRGSA